jgi:hypothetical protein
MRTAKKNTARNHYNDKLVNAVQENNPCLQWESYYMKPRHKKQLLTAEAATT